MLAGFIDRVDQTPESLTTCGSDWHSIWCPRIMSLCLTSDFMSDQATNPNPHEHTLVIATRQSPLALWQANHVKARLEALHSGLSVTLETFVTQGDKILDTPLAKIGGKGLFVKELEHALLDGRADIAVHSCKDLPMDLPEGLDLPVIMQREDPTDALVSNQFACFDELPMGAVVGTSSLRRKTQLLAARPDLQIRDLRGNVGTRLGKLDTGEYDAIVLATSGLLRLKLGERIAQTLDKQVSLPAVGQGALAIETRSGDTRVLKLITPLICDQTQACVRAERAMNRALEGGCQVPIAGHATLDGDQLTLIGRVANDDGSVVLEATKSGASSDAAVIGLSVANELKSQGADQILAAFYTR